MKKDHPIQELIERFKDPWENAATHSHCRLLRLALLRDVMRALHTKRSEAMALGKGRIANELTRQEEMLNSRFQALPVETLSLEKILSDAPIVSAKKKHELPKELLSAIGPERLPRHDRTWEAELASEALKQGWGFWRLSASSEVSKVEPFARWLNDAAWPAGVVLFVESDGFAADLWRGKWTWVFQKEPPHLDFSTYPFSNPLWSKLYPA